LKHATRRQVHRSDGQVRARLVADGFDVSDTRPGHKPGTRVCSVRDGSCGVPTLLIEAATRPD
jgi:hypothetical protein